MRLLTATLLLVAAAGSAGAGDGQAEYVQACASCHGETGRGDGPLARELATRPTDLTGLSAGNGGEFPYWMVFATIDGRHVVPGHGERDMPVWGSLFNEEETRTHGPKGGEQSAMARIHDLAAYVRSLQR